MAPQRCAKTRTTPKKLSVFRTPRKSLLSGEFWPSQAVSVNSLRGMEVIDRNANRKPCPPGGFHEAAQGAGRTPMSGLTTDTFGIYYVVTAQQEGLTMVKTLTRHGNSYALIIDKPILELLRAAPDTPFEIVTDGNSLVLTPVRGEDEERRFQDAVNMVHTRFGGAMRKLAE